MSIKGYITEQELSDELKGKINQTEAKVHLSATEPTVDPNTNNIWYDLKNCIIKTKVKNAKAWTEFGAIYL